MCLVYNLNILVNSANSYIIFQNIVGVILAFFGKYNSIYSDDSNIILSVYYVQYYYIT